MRYVWDREHQCFVDRDGRPMQAPDRICRPMIISDTPAYMSPLGTGEIDGRRARREDLARHNCREVDPTEYKPRIKSEKFARKHGLPFEG